MSGGDEARVKILHLAAEVAETEDSNVPIRLKQLQKILADYSSGTEVGAKVRQDIWNFDVLHVCSLALLQDFTPIEGGWSTAASLCSIICQCCDGAKLQASLEFNQTFLPNVLDNMLNLSFKIQEVYLATEQRARHDFYRNYKDVTDSILWLVRYAPSLNIKVLESKRLMQMLMVEDEETSLLILALIHCILRRDRSVLGMLSEEKRNSLLDELIYKISASEDISVGRSACQLLLMFIDRQPSLVEILSSRKYRGLKTYLSKWKGKGFDQDLKKLTRILEAGDMAQAHLLKKDLAASIIQACYKGYKERQMLKKMRIGLVKFQRLYRRYRARKDEERTEIMWKREKQLHEDISRNRDFRHILNKNLKTLEYLPANKVQEYFIEQQEVAALKIQAAFRGMRTRRQIATWKHERMFQDAAVVIQRQFRRYLMRKKAADKITFQSGPPGLDDARREDIQEMILRYRENVAHKSLMYETVKEHHYETQRLLGNHLMLYGKARKSEQRREALIAKMNVDAELLLGAPKLKDVNSEMVDMYTSRSTPVMIKAQICHAKDIVNLKAPWWKRLWNDDGQQAIDISKNDQEMNF